MKLNSLRMLGLLSVLFAAAPGLAEEHEHGVGRIQNESMDLYYIDHVLTGRIGNRPVFSKPLTDAFGATLWHRAEGQDFETVFKSENDVLSGPVRSLQGQNKIESRFTISEINAQQGLVKGAIDETVFTVQVTAEKMQGHHYVDPHFRVELNSGKIIEFSLEGGQACIGCVTRLSYAILSMLHATGNL
ncbi:MAG: hypothetical protein R3B54_07375 [Bdellovibrionota bacterium]